MTQKEAEAFRKKYILVHNEDLVDEGHRTYQEYERLKDE